MILLAIGKKGSGKSTALRRLAYRALVHRSSRIFYHDSGVQVTGGVLFTSIAAARAHFARAGIPHLSVFRGVEVEDVASLALQVHDVTLVIDELDRACSGKVWKSPSVRRIVHEGRHERVHLWGTFRSTRNVNEDLVGQADAVLVLRHSESSPYDLQTVRQRFGESVAAASQQLEPMQFVVWQDE